MGGFVSLTNALAWPLATLAIAFMFRAEARQMLGRMGRLKYRDLEVTFSEGLRQAEELARAIPSLPPPPPTTPVLPAPAKGAVVLETETSEPAELAGSMIGEARTVPSPRSVDPVREGLARHLSSLAGRSPRDAVVEAWATIGQGLLQAAATLADRKTPIPARPDDAARLLADRGRLTAPEAQLLDRLRLIRDRLDHQSGANPAPDDARRYVDLAVPILSLLETLGRP